MAKKETKAWYDDIDAATLQRIKTYSAFNDATSKNLMMQTMYEYREKEIQDFKETNHELAETCIARKKRIDELEKENDDLKNKIGKVAQEILDNWCKGNPPCPHLKKRDEQLTKAKEIILKLYNAGRDVLMCRVEEKAYDNLSKAINDRSIEQFLGEVEHD